MGQVRFGNAAISSVARRCSENPASARCTEFGILPPPMTGTGKGHIRAGKPDAMGDHRVEQGVSC